MWPDKKFYRIVLIGDSGVGKSSLLSQFMKESFTEEFISTIGIDVGFKNIAFPISETESCNLTLRIFDTAGQRKFETITERYQTSSTDGLIVVFDITDHHSFLRSKDLIHRSREINPLGDSLPILLVGNKIDLAIKRCVPHTDARKFAKEEGCSYMETSAKENNKVTEIFDKIVELILESQQMEVEDVQFEVDKANKPNVKNFKTKMLDLLLWCMCIQLGE